MDPPPKMPLQGNTKPQPTSLLRATDTPGQAELRRLYPQIRAQNPNTDLNLMLNSVKNMTPNQVRAVTGIRSAPERPNIFVAPARPTIRGIIRDQIPTGSTVRKPPRPASSMTNRARGDEARSDGISDVFNAMNGGNVPVSAKDASAPPASVVAMKRLQDERAKLSKSVRGLSPNVADAIINPQEDATVGDMIARSLTSGSTFPTAGLIARSGKGGVEAAKKYIAQQEYMSPGMQIAYRSMGWDPTTGGTAGRAFSEGIIPAGGGLASFNAGGAAAAGIAASATKNPIATGAAYLLGGTATAMGAGGTFNAAQDAWLGDELYDFYKRKRQQDRERTPFVDTVANQLPQGLFSAPSSSIKQFATGGLLGGGLDIGQQLFEQLAQDGKIDLSRIDKTRAGIAAGTGAVFNSDTRLSSAITNPARNAGERAAAMTVRTASALAQAARDAGVSLEAARRIPVPSPITNPDAYRAAVLKRAAEHIKKTQPAATAGKVIQRTLSNANTFLKSHTLHVPQTINTGLPVPQIVPAKNTAPNGSTTSGTAPPKKLRDPRDPNAPIMASYSASKTKEIIAAKLAVKEAAKLALKQGTGNGQWNVSEVQNIIKKHYRKNQYEAGLAGKQNIVYFVMPSTSGTNILPRYLADQLNKDFPGKIVRGETLVTPTATIEAKNRLGSAKINSPSGYKPLSPGSLSVLQGTNVVIVDDFHTTGESSDALIATLRASGVNNIQTAFLAGQNMRPATLADAQRFARLIAQGSLLEIKPEAEIKPNKGKSSVQAEAVSQEEVKAPSPAEIDAQKKAAQEHEEKVRKIAAEITPAIHRWAQGKSIGIINQISRGELRPHKDANTYAKRKAAAIKLKEHFHPSP